MPDHPRHEGLRTMVSPSSIETMTFALHEVLGIEGLELPQCASTGILWCLRRKSKLCAVPSIAAMVSFQKIQQLRASTCCDFSQPLIYYIVVGNIIPPLSPTHPAPPSPESSVTSVR